MTQLTMLLSLGMSWLIICPTNPKRYVNKARIIAHFFTSGLQLAERQTMVVQKSKYIPI